MMLLFTWATLLLSLMLKMNLTAGRVENDFDIGAAVGSAAGADAFDYGLCGHPSLGESLMRARFSAERTFFSHV